VDEKLGPTTCNIGTLSGGRKPNVVPDQAASELMFRTVIEAEAMFQRIEQLVGDRATVKRGFHLPPIHLKTVDALANRCFSAPARFTRRTQRTNLLSNGIC
jgi:acetylornithine deacetylase